MSLISTDSWLAEIDSSRIDFRPCSDIYFKNIEYRNVVKESEDVMRKLLKDWLTNVSNALEEFLREMNEEMEKMSPEQRAHMYAQYFIQQNGRSPMGFF